MPNNRLILGGISDLEWRTLAPDMAKAADPILNAGAERAKDALIAAYPRITGQLEQSVRVEDAADPDPLTVGYVVSSNAPYAHIYEFGSHRQRARPTFLPITRRENYTAMGKVSDMVKAMGFVVTGNR